MNFTEIINTIKNLDTVVLLMVFNAFLYPLSRWFFPFIKNKNVSAFLHAAFGIFMSYGLFGTFDTCIMLAFVFVSYFLLNLGPLWASIICFSMTMATHVYILLQGVSWALDITGISMVVFQKVCSLTFNLKDGKDEAEGKKIRPRWSAAAIQEKPNIVVFFGYCFTPYGSFSNPFIEFKVFDYMINIGNRKEPLTKEDKYLALKRFIEAYICSIVTKISFSFVGYENFTSEWYLKLPIIARTVVVVLNTLFTVTRYFCSWWIVESGLYGFGVASSGLFENTKEEVSNLSLLEVLNSGSCQEWMRRWNHTTHLFWKNYLFSRLRANGYSAQLGNMAVFICSSAWHGCRPVYFMMLPESFIIMEIDKIFCKKFPLNRNSWLSVLVHDSFVACTMLYTTCTWFYPWVNEFFYVRKSVCFLPFLMSLVLGAILFLIPSKKTPKQTQPPAAETKPEVKEADEDKIKKE